MWLVVLYWKMVFLEDPRMIFTDIRMHATSTPTHTPKHNDTDRFRRKFQSQNNNDCTINMDEIIHVQICGTKIYNRNRFNSQMQIFTGTLTDRTSAAMIEASAATSGTYKNPRTLTTTRWTRTGRPSIWWVFWKTLNRCVVPEFFDNYMMWY